MDKENNNDEKMANAIRVVKRTEKMLAMNLGTTRIIEKIDRAVVKALWADMEWEKSESGMIVTTSSIAHGAKKDCIARGYNISQADSETIQTWLEKMRTPSSGVFMGT